MSRCSATTVSGKPCTRAARGNGRCPVHGGFDPEPEPERAMPCRCERPVWNAGADGASSCLACGRGPISSAVELARWLRFHPSPEPTQLAAVLRGWRAAR